MKLGIGNHATDTELRVQDMTFGEFADKLSKPKIGPKDGLYVVRGGRLKEPKRADANLIEAELIVVDGDSRFDPETGEVLSGAPDFDVTCEAFKSLGVPFVLHTTHSNQPGKPKWRGYIPAVMSSPAELSACVGAVIEHLNGAGCFVVQSKECTTWSQAWFTPRVPSPEALEWFRFHAATEGNSFNVAAAVAVAQRQALTEEAVERVQAAPKPTPNVNGPSPIEAFNASATIETVRYMLEQAGYKLAYRRGDTLRMIAPGSETGTAGVHVFKGRQRGDIVAYSHHGGHDPLSGRLNDAFGVLTRVRHKGDQDAAIAEAKAVVGWASRRDPTEGFEVIAEDFRDASRPTSVLEAGETDTAWQLQLVTTARGRLVWNQFNAAMVIRNHKDWDGVFAFNDFTSRPTVLRDVPGTTTRDVFPRDLRDSDYTAAACWFNQNGFETATKNLAADAVDMVARESVLHPVRNYLTGLKWDGGKRLGSWLRVYCSAKIQADDHNRYVDDVGLRWMISAVARVMRPGCKVDSALILEGQQGCGKSSLLRILCGPDWFGDSLPTFGTKDASSYLQGRWIIELAELSNVSKSEVEEIKAFITRTEERYRPAYGRNEIVFQRQCVFAGTTNAETYLRDETGNRRFWPVTVGKVDLERLEADRDQLWAEAVALFKAGEQWHLTQDVHAASEREQQSRHMEDPWMGRVSSFLLGKSEVTISEVAIDGLGFEVSRVGRADANRIVGILRLIGWGRDGVFNDRTSGRRAMARYVNKGGKA